MYRKNALSLAVGLGLTMLGAGSHALTCSTTADSWGTGYIANVTVTNDSTSAINDWTVTLDFNQNAVITGSWNAIVQASGTQASASNVGWNGSLSPNQSISFGFQGTHTGSFEAPVCSAGPGTPQPTPTAVPTVAPTALPTVAPTALPTVAPTAIPTVAPTAVPTALPTATPTIAPTAAPTALPTVTPTQQPADDDLVLQENETGFCVVDGSIDNNNSGFTGSGFANTENANNRAITWKINVENPGSYILEWRYASGSSNNRTGIVSVNGSTESTVDFSTTGSWTSWTIDSAVVNLEAGVNEIVLASTTSEGLANIDALTIAGSGITAADCDIVVPTPTAGPTMVPTPTSIPTATPVPTQVPTATPTQTPTPTQAPTPTSVPTPVSGELVAFPGAEGYGKYTTGGRGGDVYIVTNLNSSGAGSLKDALSKGGRTVVFAVSGTITGRFNVPNNTTIAGQTAPGDGITIFGQMTHGSNVIVRYIRVRFDGKGNEDAFGKRYQNNVMVDHVTASWSRDEVMSIYHGENVTIQWSLISEACPNEGTDSHRFGAIWGNEFGTYHHNLIAHNENRTPRWASGGGHNDYRNNVTYNWGYGGSYGAEKHQVGNDNFIGTWTNVIGNYYKPGPGSEGLNKIVEPKKRSAGDEGNWYVADNYVDGSPATNADNWKGVLGNSYIKMSAPWDAMPINQDTPEQAYEKVLADVGASVPRRDSIDERIISDVRNGTATLGSNGFISCPADTVLPVLYSTPAPKDSDKDGMPDSWEQANGLNPNDASDRNKKDAIGYTMLENYLNSIDSL